MAVKLGKVYKSGGTNQQVQGNDEYVVITTSYSDGSIIKSGHIGDMSIDNTFESWDWGDSSADYVFQAWYTPKATKTTENGLEYLGNGAYTPSDITIEKLPREEIIIQKNPVGFKRPIIDNSKAEHLREIEILYTSFPDSDDSNVDGYDATATQDKSALKRLGMAGYLPNNWWKDPFVIINSKKGNGSNDDSLYVDNTSELEQIILPKTFTKKSVDKITNFNPSTDTLEIDTDSFGIDSSATFAAGKNMKAVKKKLANKNFDFLYDEKKGGLYFNENGSDKGFGDGGIIAILKGAPDLTSGNLEFI